MATTNLPNNSLATLQSYVTAAAVGDTLVVPVGSGSVSWSGFTLNKGVWIQGPGRDVLTVNGSVTLSVSSSQRNNTFEFSGFTINGSSPIDFEGPGSGLYTTGIKVHDCRFIGGTVSGVTNGNPSGAFGVIYNCEIRNAYKLFADDLHGGESEGWNLPYAFGSPYYLYIEDCAFVRNSGTTAFCSETGQGGRCAIRFSTVTGCNDECWDVHGVNGSYPTSRGTVITEFYGNTLTNNSAGRVLNHRGGQLVCLHNTFVNSPGALDFLGASSTWSWGAGWPDNVHDSYYANNSGKTPALNEYPEREPYCRLNRDYWLCSYGLEANRPANPSVNDTYTTTDSVANHALPIKIWRCQSAGAWTLVYTSYTYPHPLRGAAPSPPAGTPVLSVR